MAELHRIGSKVINGGVHVSTLSAGQQLMNHRRRINRTVKSFKNAAHAGVLAWLGATEGQTISRNTITFVHLHVLVDIHKPLHARVSIVNRIVPIVVDQKLLRTVIVHSHLAVGSAANALKCR
jgi:hypothetical protein